MNDETPDKEVLRFTSAHDDPLLGMFEAIREWLPDNRDKLPLRPYVFGGAGDPVIAFECDDGSKAWEVSLVGVRESASLEDGDPAVYPDLLRSVEGRREIARRLTLAGRASGTHSISNCARCGGDHDDLEFEVLARPAPSSDLEYTAWCPCPTNGQPILMETLEASDAVEGDPVCGTVIHKLRQLYIVDSSGAEHLWLEPMSVLYEKWCAKLGVDDDELDGTDDRRLFTSEDDLDGLDFRECIKTAGAEAVRVDEPFLVRTLEGDMQGAAGDYLMRGVAGELYPCDADIFENTYEWADAGDD